MSLLDELKEKRQDAIENFETQGADIEVTREQLADQQRVRAFWAAQIVDLDKAISALTPEGKEALLDDQPEPVPTEVRKQDEQDAAGDERAEMIAAVERGESEVVEPADSSAFKEFMYLTGATRHDGGPCPVSADAHLEIFTRGCREWPIKNIAEVATHWTWRDQQPHATDIVAYRIVAAPAAPPPAQEAPAIPEGFIPWGGGEYLPVARGTPLVVLYRNGSEVDCTAGDEMSEFWHRSSTLVDHSPDHDIIAYRVIETGETQSELDSSQIEGGDRVEPLHDRPKLTNEEFESLEKIDGVLDAEPSPILRSEVPPAAETYLAPSGDEFATVNGQTHLIVSDEAEAQGQAETAPQAAYAPIHNEDEPSDAAVFAHGLNVEIDQKAEPKRINIFGIEFGGGAKKTLVGEGV